MPAWRDDPGTDHADPRRVTGRPGRASARGRTASGAPILVDDADLEAMRARVGDALGDRLVAIAPSVVATEDPVDADALAAGAVVGAQRQPQSISTVGAGDDACVVADAPAMMLLTSGSTGHPKLVVQTHATVLAQVRAFARRCEVSAADVGLNWLPLEHVGALVMSHLRDVHAACRQVQAPAAAVFDRPQVWLDWLERFGVTLSWAPQFAFSRIAALGESIDAASRRLGHVRMLINGGESIVGAQARAFLRLLSPAGLRDDAIRPAWGMSETCSAVTISDRFPGGDDEGPVDLGEPIDAVELRIVDEDGRPLPGGEDGELQVRGDCVTPGYHGNRAATIDSFTSDGWFRTGDIGWLRDGRLHLCGRSKDMLAVNGRQLACVEVEAAAEQDENVSAGSAAAFQSSDDAVSVLVFVPLDSTPPGFVRPPGACARPSRMPAGPDRVDHRCRRGLVAAHGDRQDPTQHTRAPTRVGRARTAGRAARNRTRRATRIARRAAE
ncbi:MAG: AMP-binding protein [Burkholderiaceae bacterium]